MPRYYINDLFWKLIVSIVDGFVFDVRLKSVDVR